MPLLIAGVERKPERTREPRALDAGRVEAMLGQIADPRDHALFWLIYDGGLRCEEGATAFCCIRSYLSTMRKQGRCMLGALEAVFAGCSLPVAWSWEK